MIHSFDDEEPVVIRLRGDGFEDFEPIVIHLAGDRDHDRTLVRDVGQQLPVGDFGLEITVAADQRADLQAALGGLDLGPITLIEIDPVD